MNLGKSGTHMTMNKLMPGKRMRRGIRPLIAAAAMVAGSTLASTLAGCKLYEAPPFDPKRIQEIQSGAVNEPTAPTFDPLPGQLEPSLTPERRPAVLPHIRATTRPYGQEVPVKLQEIIARTVANTLEARIAGYQSAIDEQRIMEAEAR